MHDALGVQRRPGRPPPSIANSNAWCSGSGPFALQSGRERLTFQQLHDEELQRSSSPTDAEPTSDRVQMCGWFSREMPACLALEPLGARRCDPRDGWRAL